MSVSSEPRPPVEQTRTERRAGQGVKSNARLTASNAAVLLVLLAAEGVTILRVRELVTPHVFIGMLLIPPVLVKIGSTGYRFVRYYIGSPAYRRKGPPSVLLRLLGPVVVILTGVVLASGVALLLADRSWSAQLLLVHKASFVLWFFAMIVHVLGHLAEVARLAPRDWLRRTRREVRGAGERQWLIAASLVAGVLLGLAMLSRVGPWLALARVGHLAPRASRCSVRRRPARTPTRAAAGPAAGQPPRGRPGATGRLVAR